MRAGTVDRVKQQLLRDAVAENLETIRGGPPRNKRPERRPENVWMRRLPLLLIPVTLLGSSYLVSEPPVFKSQPLARAEVAPPRAHVAEQLVDSPEAVKAEAFPLAVRRIVLDAGHGGKDAG